MKTAILLFFISASCFAGDITFTNKIATFTNLQGRLYDTVLIERANSSGIVYRSGGTLGMVAYTNLSPATLEEIGVPLDRLDAAKARAEQSRLLAVQQMKMDAEEESRLQNPSNFFEITILSPFVRQSVNVMGGLCCCKISGPRGELTAWIRGMPSELIANFQNVSTLEQSVAQLSNQISVRSAQIKAAQYEHDRLDAVAPTGAYGDINYVNTTMAPRNQANLMQVDINTATSMLVSEQDNLSDLNRKLTQLKVEQSSLSKLRVMQSRTLWDNLPIYIVGK